VKVFRPALQHLAREVPVKKLLFAAVAVCVVVAPILVLAYAPAPDAGSRTVEHKTYNGYAESRDSGQKGDASFLAITSKTEFSRIFDPVLTPRGAPDPVAKDAFDARLFVAVIKRDEVLWDYKVEKVTANGETLTVRYTAAPRKGPLYAGVTILDKRGETKRAGATEKAAPLATAKATVKEAPRATAAVGRPITTEKAPRSSGKDTYVTGPARRSSGAFDSPLIVSVPKDKYLTVVFVENGRKAGTARVGD
jgi:hypothetical protein